MSGRAQKFLAITDVTSIHFYSEPIKNAPGQARLHSHSLSQLSPISLFFMFVCILERTSDIPEFLLSAGLKKLLEI